MNTSFIVKVKNLSFFWDDYVGPPIYAGNGTQNKLTNLERGVQSLLNTHDAILVSVDAHPTPHNIQM